MLVLFAALTAAAPLRTPSTWKANPTDEPCDPLVPESCVLPWPNDFYVREDTTTVTGKRVNYKVETFPLDNQGRPIDPFEWNTFDGHSPAPIITTYFPGPDISVENLPHHWDIAQSLQPNCSTILLDTSTGELVPHWSEVNRWADYFRPDVDHRRAFLITPAHRLKDGTRYIVATQFLRDVNGNLVQPSAAFQALRDGVPTEDPAIEYRRSWYETDIFPRLAAAGAARGSLQIAWDFTTASKESITGRLVSARDDAFQRMPIGGPEYRVTDIRDEYNDLFFRRMEIDIMCPSYMTTTRPGSVFVLDEAGKPVFQEMFEYQITVMIPRTFVENPRKARILEYGHGLFGYQEEVDCFGGTNCYLGRLANEYGYVLFAGDWLGMSAPDAVAVVLMMLSDFSQFRIIPDRSQQGLICKMYAMRAMMTSLGQDPTLFRFGGVDIIDPSQRSYFGNSQGGILGGAYMAASQDIERGVLGVPGAPYSLLLPRSVDFDSYAIPIRLRYPEALDQITIVNLIQPVWDRGEPSGYMSYMSSNTLPDTPSHNVLLHYGLHDSEVTWLGAFWQARSCNAAIFGSNVLENNETLFGFDQFGDDVTLLNRNLVQGWSYERPPVPRENIPPVGSLNTHGLPRQDPDAFAQMDLFFRTGQVKNMCEGACVCPYEGCH